MSKFLKIIRENSASLDNPNAVFYLKLVDNNGQEVGYDPIELRGTTYASDFFLKIQDMVGRGGDFREEDNEVELAKLASGIDKGVATAYTKAEKAVKPIIPKIKKDLENIEVKARQASLR